MLDAMTGLPAHTRGILFDFNGTLSDDEDLLRTCYDLALGELGHPGLRPGEYEALLGRSEPDIAEELIRARGGAETPALIDAVARHYRRGCLTTPRVSRATAAMVHRLADTHALGIVTGTLRRLIEPVLADLGIAGCFRTVITIEDVRHGKPDPEGFLRGASELGIDPAQILVLEDSAAGVAAARAAGMDVIAVGAAAGLPGYLERIEDLQAPAETPTAQ